MHAPTWREFLFYWGKFGFISFGGPAAQISILHRDLVEKQKWISEEEFERSLAFVSILPGPEAHQLATYIGRKFFGTLGGITAGVFFLFPSLLLISGLSWAYLEWSVNSDLSIILDGLRAGVLALVLFTAFRLARKINWTSLKLLFATLFVLFQTVLNLPIILLVILAIAIGVLASTRIERTYDSFEIPWEKVVTPLILGTAIWLISYLSISQSQLLKDIANVFTQGALITFGGAYSVIPFVSQAAVSDYGWLTHAQMLDGLALGESTPGPLIMINAFVGFIAYGGFIGAFVATWFTFLPSTVLVFAGAPVLIAITKNERMKVALSWLSVAVVTFIIGFGWAVYSNLGPDYRLVQLLISLFGFVVLVRSKLSATLVLFFCTAVYVLISFVI